MTKSDHSSRLGEHNLTETERSRIKVICDEAGVDFSSFQFAVDPLGPFGKEPALTSRFINVFRGVYRMPVGEYEDMADTDWVAQFAIDLKAGKFN